ncbi:DNA repair protein RecN [Halothiobacillus neapolitanus]|uniref:DNA repair protein RecN n=1 Tax=Halothiobacillus neapolitanus (strain ATCC 23641 / DSM 15147 / CIP 104769 / NCIMB 8539 / c2) TaxID=555778 RepID=D0L0T4_HALNC|nr:DNA repair protein RecN [Halothiobacillus neapolitanus]ACX96307.1 DNA repair protein RecN [Halothiobacillus neapolitanus c2]TDN66618.1 DNA replication and repair protein RecN [Halothiobacillus neapolitanus]
MLTSLTIRHIALIDEIEIQFATGMTTLTGETGAGKSILIDAIGLIQGERANTQLIRTGYDDAEVIAVFHVTPGSPVAEFLEEQELLDDELIIRRSLNREGRGKIWINGRPCPAATLKTLGGLLIDVHGQHHNQKLLEKRYQRLLLDSFAGLTGQTQKLAQLSRELRHNEHKLEEIRNAEQSREDRRALLTFQLEEIDQIDPQPDEFNQCHQLLSRLSRQDEWRSVLAAQLEQLFDGDENVHDRIGHAQQALARIVGLDDALSPLIDALETAQIQISETADTLRDRLDSVEDDPEQLERVQARLEQLHQLARKHRIPPEQLDDMIAGLREEATSLDHAQADSAALEAAIQAQMAAFDELAADISSKRKTAAAKLAAAVTEAIRLLGMPHGQIEIPITPVADPSARGEHGIDDVVFLISANRGQPPQPLDQIASGGELARVSLAFKTLTAAFDPVETFIFDEVDTGIGGAIAEIVGRHLRALGQTRQVFCVTHLPQVAAQGQHQIQVQKHHLESGTVTEIVPLDLAARIDEIARMIGGIDITAQTRATAQEMLARD